MTLTRPYTGVRNVWAPEQMGVFSGAKTLSPVTGPLGPEDVEEHVLAEYKGEPEPLQVQVGITDAPLLASDPLWVAWARCGRLVWDTGFARWASDVRSGLYQVPSTPYFRLSVQRYNFATGTDTSDDARVAAAVLPGVTAPSAEWVRTAIGEVAAGANLDFDFRDSLYRSAQLYSNSEVGDDTQIVLLSSAGSPSVRLLHIDYLTPFRFPAFPRVPILGTEDVTTTLRVENASAANTINPTIQVYSGPA